MMKEIITLKEIKTLCEIEFDTDFKDLDDYEKQVIIEDFLVEYRGYSHGGGHNAISDLDFEVKGNKIIAEVEAFDDSDNEDFK